MQHPTSSTSITACAGMLSPRSRDVLSGVSICTFVPVKQENYVPSVVSRMSNTQKPHVPQKLALHTSAYASIRQHTSAYVSIRQHTSAYVSIRQHTSAYVSRMSNTQKPQVTQKLALPYVSIRQHTSQYLHFCTSKASKLSMRQHPSK
jgi:hypothetical protein